MIFDEEVETLNFSPPCAVLVKKSQSKGAAPGMAHGGSLMPFEPMKSIGNTCGFPKRPTLASMDL